VQGTVTDPSQAVIVGAKVTLANINTAVSTTRQTDQTGRYLFDLVPPGTNTVTLECSGFSRLVQENVVVSARGDVTVNATLVQPDTARENEPYFTWSGNRQEVAGSRNYSNDLQIDGRPKGTVGHLILKNKLFKTEGNTPFSFVPVGHLILKNKLFKFFAYEWWRKTDQNDS